ncbi:MAG: phosphoribosylglycinamide formyltransferase [Firmicutes bacterium HGW-Firmicutes-1]|jgi:phosphoribosylglycinamide formyltransferase-1|nr:MAG: phosphoribosylglycinamide formyltransferase [Firmicutes bacterium HGW-Firmicutes-1]
MLRVGILVSGGGTNLQAILDAIENGSLTNTKIVAVVSNRQKAYGLERARLQGIEACCIRPIDFENREAFNDALKAYFLEKEVDLVVLAGYLVVLSEEFIKAFPNKILNIHPSLIPAFCGDGYYGLKVHEAVLHRGVKLTGATVHFVDEGTDTGPIVLQKAVPVLQDDTAEILQKRVMEEAEWKLLPEAIGLIALNKIKIIDGHVIIDSI